MSQMSLVFLLLLLLLLFHISIVVNSLVQYLINSWLKFPRGSPLWWGKLKIAKLLAYIEIAPRNMLKMKVWLTSRSIAFLNLLLKFLSISNLLVSWLSSLSMSILRWLPRWNDVLDLGVRLLSWSIAVIVEMDSSLYNEGIIICS